MGPIRALFKKEMLEIVGDRQSRRGGLVQGAVFALVLGVLTVKPEAWLAAEPSAVFFFAYLPGIAAAAVAADAFAGERERRTLETLLASPIDERAILLGKTAAAVAFGGLVGTAGLALGIFRVSVASGLFVPAAPLVAGALGASLVSSLFFASLAVIISMYVSVARAAQQIASISALALLAVSAAVWQSAHFAIVWPSIFGMELFILVAALVLHEVARAAFRRERFFVQR
jgi:ABC-2 type transport system permease protein